MKDYHKDNTVVSFDQPTKEEMKVLKKYCLCYMCQNNIWFGCRGCHGCLKGCIESEFHPDWKNRVENARQRMALKKSERANTSSTSDITTSSKCIVM
jgi:hypothetical protein